MTENEIMMIKYISDLNNRQKSNSASLMKMAAEPQHYTGVVPPLCLTSTFLSEQPSTGESKFFYTRSNNPNFSLLEKQLARLHSGKKALVYSTGMAAISATLFSLAPRSIVAAQELFCTTNSCLKDYKNLTGCELKFMDICAIEQVVETLQTMPKPRMLYCEIISNPSTSKIVNIPALSAMIHKKVRDCLIVVDNTWLSPALYRPLEPFKAQGSNADIVIESGTKYLSGDGSVLLGAVIVGNYLSKKIEGALYHWRSVHGSVPSPLSCWMISKSLESLHIRMAHICRTALYVARFLEEKLGFITRVLYPGLSSHPHHHLAQTLFDGKAGGIVFFHVAISFSSDKKYEKKAILKPLFQQMENIIYATSYGSTHSLIDPYWQHGNSRQYDQNSARPEREGVWLRLYVGLLSPEEVIYGLLSGFAKSFSKPIGTPISAFFPQIGVIKFVFAPNILEPTIRLGDILVNQGAPNIQFYDVLEEPRQAEGENGATILTVRVSGNPRPKMNLDVLSSGSLRAE